MKQKAPTERSPAASFRRVDFPAGSMIAEKSVIAASFVDSYQIELPADDFTVVDAFLAIFGDKPLLMKVSIILRNILVKPLGLDTATIQDVLSNVHKPNYRTGDVICGWPIVALTEEELVAGRDNGHMDFRVSVLKSVIDGRPFATVSTVCVTHNRAGEIYLKAILPIHKPGLRFLLDRAAARSFQAV